MNTGQVEVAYWISAGTVWREVTEDQWWAYRGPEHTLAWPSDLPLPPLERGAS